MEKRVQTRLDQGESAAHDKQSPDSVTVCGSAEGHLLVCCRRFPSCQCVTQTLNSTHI